MNKQFVSALFASTCFVTASTAWTNASMAAAASAVPVVSDGIAGTVTGAKGPEAGVWVIAETHDLPTKFIKIVVTDDQGRYVLPELPKAKYDVWVRGYGLVDSPHVAGTPGKNVDLKSVQAPDGKAAAEYYPANYWLALMKIPAESEFPGTGPKGNGIALNIKTQQQWLQQLKGCTQCHQQGDKTTRTLLNNSPEGWAERITKQRAPGDQAIGNTGPEHAAAMQNQMSLFGRTRGLGMFADFTQRVAKGELPPTPPRPQGIERNIVLTSWDWGNGRYIHDLTSTDRNNPTLNANGPIYGITAMTGYIEVLNPMKSEASEFGYKVDETKGVKVLSEPDPDHTGVPHNPMLDSEGRLWLTDRGYRDQKDYAKAPPKMAYCNDPNASPYAKYYPQSGKATATLVNYDPKTKAIAGVSMCNTLHHLMQATDGKMYTSGADLASWVDVKAWDKNGHDQTKVVGWCPFVLDTNSKTPSKAGALSEVVITPDREQWNKPAASGRRGMDDPESTAVGGPEAAPIDPKLDTRISGGTYGMDVDVTDGGIWYGRTGPWPSSIVKFNPGTNPPETCRSEVYESAKLPNGDYEGFNIRGMSVDSKGVAWAAFAQGRLGKLDRTKCKVLTGPTATGQQCPEGWNYYNMPGPGFAGVKNAATDFAYLMWVDLHDTLGLGKDTPIVTGSNSDSLLAFDQKSEKWTVLRVPYPMDFHTRGMDGRIDSTAAGWKGKGVYATYAMQPVWHEEGGDDGLSGPTMVKFQVRPDPLAY